MQLQDMKCEEYNFWYQERAGYLSMKKVHLSNKECSKVYIKLQEIKLLSHLTIK